MAALSVLVRASSTIVRGPLLTPCWCRLHRQQLAYPLINLASKRYASSKGPTSVASAHLSALKISDSTAWNEIFDNLKDSVQANGTKDANALCNLLLQRLQHHHRFQNSKNDPGLSRRSTDDQQEKLNLLRFFSEDLRQLNDMASVWDRLEHLWTKRYEELLEYYVEHGHSMVPTDGRTHKQLGRWVSTQRQLYKQSLQGTLPKGTFFSNKQIRLLQEVDFVWDPLENYWTKLYEELVEYYKEHGHSMVPNRSQTHQELGTWVTRQRGIYKKRIQGKLPKGSGLSNERIRLLNELNFVWDPNEYIWTKRYEELVEYYKEHGHTMVSQERETHKELGNWINNQRKLYKQKIQGTLSKRSGFSNERVCLLNELDFVWDPLENDWTKRYEELVEYYKKHGHSMVPQKSQTHQELGTWVTRQRELYRHNKQGKPGESRMTDACIRLLNEVNFVWDPYEDSWTKRYEELVEYYKEHGHSMVSQRSKTHKELGIWVGNQRQLYKQSLQGTLYKGTFFSNEQIRLLNELDFVWDPLEYSWTKRYEELVEYYIEHGHSKVPHQSLVYKELGRWVHKQRRCYKQKIEGKSKQPRMTDERIRLLNELDFVWDPNEVAWRAQYQKLEAHAKKHGRGAFIKDRSIINWLIEQRKKYEKWKDGQKSTMTKDRLRLLEKLGYTFNDHDAY
jgi:hypothetical protein